MQVLHCYDSEKDVTELRVIFLIGMTRKGNITPPHHFLDGNNEKRVTEEF